MRWKGCHEFSKFESVLVVGFIGKIAEQNIPRTICKLTSDLYYITGYICGYLHSLNNILIHTSIPNRVTLILRSLLPSSHPGLLPSVSSMPHPPHLVPIY